MLLRAIDLSPVGGLNFNGIEALLTVEEVGFHGWGLIQYKELPRAVSIGATKYSLFLSAMLTRWSLSVWLWMLCSIYFEIIFPAWDCPTGISWTVHHYGWSRVMCWVMPSYYMNLNKTQLIILSVCSMLDGAQWPITLPRPTGIGWL